MTKTTKTHQVSDEARKAEEVVISLGQLPKYHDTYTGSVADPKARADFKDHTEQEFIEEQRAKGFTDEQISKMVGRSVKFVQHPEIVDHSHGKPTVTDEVSFRFKRRVPLISDDERRERDRRAKDTRAWHAPKPKP